MSNRQQRYSQPSYYQNKDISVRALLSIRYGIDSAFVVTSSNRWSICQLLLSRTPTNSPRFVSSPTGPRFGNERFTDDRGTELPSESVRSMVRSPTDITGRSISNASRGLATGYLPRTTTVTRPSVAPVECGTSTRLLPSGLILPSRRIHRPNDRSLVQTTDLPSKRPISRPNDRSPVQTTDSPDESIGSRWSVPCGHTPIDEHIHALCTQLDSATAVGESVDPFTASTVSFTTSIDIDGSPPLTVSSRRR